jgi:cell shape-determining protein MreD
MRKSSWALLGVSAIAGGLYEAAFLPSAPFPFEYIRPVLPFCVMLFMLNRRPAAYVTAFLAGMTIDLLAAAGNGWVIIRWLIVLFVVDSLSERVTTNRSLYAALALVIMARLLDRALWQVIAWLSYYIVKQPIPVESWSNLLGILVVDAFITALIFVSITFFTKRFVISINPRKERYE